VARRADEEAPSRTTATARAVSASTEEAPPPAPSKDLRERLDTSTVRRERVRDGDTGDPGWCTSGCRRRLRRRAAGDKAGASATPGPPRAPPGAPTALPPKRAFIRGVRDVARAEVALRRFQDG